jgi:hypothetical protein
MEQASFYFPLSLREMACLLAALPQWQGLAVGLGRVLAEGVNLPLVVFVGSSCQSGHV